MPHIQSSQACRNPIPRRVRFEVFKRDAFRCQYCGAHPPDVTLEVDHIEAVANGGGDEIDNLIAACFACNRGKAAVPLNTVPLGLMDKAAEVVEAEEQLAGYRLVMQAQRERKYRDIFQIVEVLEGRDWTTKERYGTIERFLKRLSFEDVLEAAEMAHFATRVRGKRHKFLWFCKVCWNKVGANES